jgi:transcription antitermination factor NusG
VAKPSAYRITTENMNTHNSGPQIREQWFAAYTFSCQEKRVAQHLATRGIEFFLPVHRNISHWKNGLRMLIEKPLFPGYVFVKIDGREKIRVLELSGVHSIVGVGPQPIPLPYEEIEALRRGLASSNAEPHPMVKTGERVMIRNGPLAGMTGIVLSQKNTTRVILTLNLIMRSISVEVDAHDLEILRADLVHRFLPPPPAAPHKIAGLESEPSVVNCGLNARMDGD